MLVTVVVVALLFGGATAIGMWIGRDAIGRATVGDCLRFTEGDERPYRLLDCGDPAAGFTLLAEKQVGHDCVEVPGTSRVFTDDSQSYCIGEKGVDLTKAINDVEPGACLAFRDDEPEKAKCRKGTVPVLLVIRDVPKAKEGQNLGDVCVERGAKNVRQTYAWGLSTVQSKTVGTWDRLLCLGPAKK